MDWTLVIGHAEIGIIDIVIFSVCMISAVFCTIRGFVNEFCHHAGVLFGFAAGFLFTSMLAPAVDSAADGRFPLWVSALISFVALTCAGYVLFRLLGSALETIVDSFNLGVVDNILGFFWGLIAAMFVISVIVYLLSLQHIFDFSMLFDSSVIVRNLIQPLLPETIETLGGLMG